MIFTQRLKYFLALLTLGVLANYTNLINHNSISLISSIYILSLSKNTFSSLSRVFFRASLLAIFSLFPIIYFSFAPVSILHVFATSIGIFSCIELLTVDFTDYSRRIKLYNFVQAILIFLGACYLGAIVLNIPLESWRLLNIDTNGMGFYIFTLTICSYLLKPKLNLSFMTSIIYLGYRSNTYFIMIAVFIAFIVISTLLKKLSSLKLSKRLAVLSLVFSLLLIAVTNYFLEWERLFNALNLILFSTGSIELLMETDPRRYALTLQGIDLVQQLSLMFPFNITGFGFSTFNYLEALSLFSSNFYTSSIDVSNYAMDARPHNIYISLPATIGFPMSFILLITALKTILFSRHIILSASLAAVMLGLAFNEFIAIPSIYLIHGLTYSKVQSQKSS